MICDVYCNWNHIDRKQWLIEEQRVSQWLDEIDDIGSHNAYKYFESEDDIGDVCLLRNAGGNVKALRNLEGK